MAAPTLTLGISLQDVFTHIGTLFTALWPILAFGIALLAIPMVVRACKSPVKSKG